jgi:hypothetical protein
MDGSTQCLLARQRSAILRALSAPCAERVRQGAPRTPPSLSDSIHQAPARRLPRLLPCAVVRGVLRAPLGGRTCSGIDVFV